MKRRWGTLAVIATSIAAFLVWTLYLQPRMEREAVAEWEARAATAAEKAYMRNYKAAYTQIAIRLERGLATADYEHRVMIKTQAGELLLLHRDMLEPEAVEILLRIDAAGF